ncbi:MAG: helicase [Synechococcaceae cyanobacterium]|nr:helicase [Synechococcaceae cyanobacterium]
MLEASAHRHLKALLQREGAPRWPHHLTLSRLVARSLRRGDHTLLRLTPGTDSSWWISLLVPLALSEAPLALVVSPELRRRLLQVEWPRLRAVGLELPCWQGPDAPASARLLLLTHGELLRAWRDGTLADRQLVIPEAERLEGDLRAALGVVVEPGDWDALRRAHPRIETSLLTLHERLSRRVLGHPRSPSQLVSLAPEDEAPLRHLLSVLGPLPGPWGAWRGAGGEGWCGWARVEPALLQWHLHRQPLEPLRELAGLMAGRGAVLAGELAAGRCGEDQPAVSDHLGLRPQVVVDLGDPPLADPLPLYAPRGQPLPNSPHYGEHLLDHARRLVLGQAGLTVVLLDDDALRRGLASALAAEFGSRVGEESTAPESNGVLCCRWSWWLEHQGRLPLPCQVVVGLLPIASLEDPLTAGRVAALRRQGRDWFRELLLPDALNRLQRAVAGLRRGGGRLAVLDGRLRGRSWGRQVLAALEPWVQLSRLRPS